MDEVMNHRQFYARTLRRLIADETKCTPESAQVLQTLSVIVDQLEVGHLHKLHSWFMEAKRRIRGVPTQAAARERHQVLRKKMGGVLQSIDLTIGDHELAELAYVLPILAHVLGVPPERTTLLPDGSRGTLRALLHHLTVTGVTSTTETERVLAVA